MSPFPALLRRVPRDVRVPLAWYVGVTLGVPALNGAAGRPGFWAHAATVLAVAGALVAVRLVPHAVTRIDAWRKRRNHEELRQRSRNARFARCSAAARR